MLSRRTLRVALLAAVLGGCIIIPVPPYGPGRIQRQVIDQIKPGETTREDVLLTLGPPTQRLSDDRIFVYDWKQVVAWIGTGGIAGGSLAGGGSGDVESRHFFAIEFGSDGRVVRREDLSASLTEWHVDAMLKRWLEGSDESESKRK